MVNTHKIHVRFRYFWSWLVRKCSGGEGTRDIPSEFEVGVLIEKYGFNRYQ